MRKLLVFSLALMAAAAAPLHAQKGVTDLGDLNLKVDVKTIPVRVSGSPAEIDQLANVAFNVHGRYRRVASGQTFDIKLTAVAANQVQVVVTKAGATVLNQVASGTSTRHAALKAADLAVEATSGQNLKGFFASKLAFISARTGKQEVYTGDLFFGEVKQITFDGKQCLTPRWSPDGSKILYTSYYRSGFPDIYLMDLQTKQRTTFASFKGTNSSARFSPSGQQVAMVLSGEGNPELYVSNAQGRQVARRTRTSAVEASPCFSPDGSRIVYTSDAAGGPQLYIIPAAGGSARRVATNISGYCAEPDWSRGDPNKIAFTVRMGRGFAIAVHDLSGRTQTRSVSDRVGSTDVIEPSWLADGRHLVCTARAANQRSIWIVDTVTGKASRISTSTMGACSQASVVGP